MRNPIPSAAPLQTSHSSRVALSGERHNTVIGVYEPAMSTKIIEWSARRIQRAAAGDHERRWYNAEVPNNPQIPAA